MKRGIILKFVEAYLRSKSVNREQRDAESKAANRTANATVAIAVFTVISVGTAIGTVCILHNQLAAMQDEQNAFVFQSEQRSVFYPAKDKLGFQITWENSGNQPTRDLSLYINGCPLPKLIGPNFKFPDVDASCRPLKTIREVHSFIGPHGHFYSVTVGMPPPLLEDIHDQKTHMYVWGWARYRARPNDSGSHVTRVCNEISDVIGNLEQPDKDTAFITRPCDYGNCTDDECRKQDIP